MAARLARGTLLRMKDYSKQAWASGKGITYEMGRREELVDSKIDSKDAAAAPFLWRVSQADLCAGHSTFSDIKGVDRILVLLSGEKVDLTLQDQDTTRLHLHDPYLFPADVPTTCQVGSATGRDLNIMWDRQRCGANVTVLSSNGQTSVPVGTDATFVVALGGCARVGFCVDAAISTDTDTDTDQEYILESCGEAIHFDQRQGNRRRHFNTARRINVFEGKACVISFVPSASID